MSDFVSPTGEKPEKIIARATGLQRSLDYENHIFADRCETHMMMDSRHTNRHESLHGGIHAILLDSACGMAASRSVTDDVSQLVVTLSLNTNYLAAPDHPHIYAVAKVTRAGRSIIYAAGEVFDGDGRLLATGSAILKRIN